MYVEMTQLPIRLGSHDILMRYSRSRESNFSEIRSNPDASGYNKRDHRHGVHVTTACDRLRVDYIITYFLQLISMITSKRRTPTTDDLLRRQERPRKRHKKRSIVERDEGEDNSASEDDDSHQETEDSESEAESDGGKWESEAEAEENSDTDSEISEDKSSVESGRLGGGLNEDSSILGSRVTMKPWPVRQPTQSPSPGPSKHVTFPSLGISPPLLSALSKMAIHAPTEIQRACIPPLLAGLIVWHQGT